MLRAAITRGSSNEVARNSRGVDRSGNAERFESMLTKPLSVSSRGRTDRSLGLNSLD
jgi:hypothetical protein